MSLDKIIVEYGADLKQIKLDLAELKRQMQSVEKTAKDSSTKMKTDFKAAESGITGVSRATTQLGASLNKTNAEFVAVGKNAQKVRQNISDVEVKAVKPLSDSVSILGKKILAAFAVGSLVSFAKEATNVTAKMQGLSTQLNFITGSNERGAQSFSKLRLLVDKLGLELVSTTEAYTKFAGAATKSGLTMSQVDEIFENVAIAAKAMNLTAEDTSGVFLALQQMISKGTVSAEELRGQLAERLPGAFSIAAKSIGVTEQQLGKMMEQGQVVSREFLPAFSTQLRATFEGAMGDATDSLTSNLNRMQNAWTEFKTTTGSMLAPLVEGMAYSVIQLQNLMNDASVQTVKENMAAMDKNIAMYREFGDEIRSHSKGIADAFGEELKKANLKTGDEVKKLGEYWKQIYLSQSEGAADFRKEGVKRGIEAIDKIVASMSELGKVTPLTKEELDKIKKALAEQERQIEENVKSVDEYVSSSQSLISLFVDFAIIEKVNADMQELNRQFSRAQSEETIKTIGIDTDKTADALLKADAAAIKLKGSLGTLNGELVNTDTSIETAKLAWDDYANAVLSVFESINQAYSYGTDYRMSLLQEELNHGLISEETYEKKRKQYAREEAKRAKALAILSITVDTARAVMAALATGNVPLSILAGATGLIELGVVANQPIPEFKKGVIDFKGKGTETSDSNLVRISKGESVITAKATKENKPILEAINKNKFDEFITSVYLKEKKSNVAVSWDDYRLLLELKKSTYASKENTQQIVRAIKETRKQHRFNA